MFRHARLVLRRGCARSRSRRSSCASTSRRSRSATASSATSASRVTTDFSMQKSLDRVAKNVRLAIQINERKKISGRVRGQQQGVVVDAARRADPADARLVRRLRGRRQRRRHPALLPGGRLLLRAGRLAPRAPVRRRGAHRLHDRRRARSCACAASSSPATSRCPPRELAEVVSVRKYPPLGLGAGGYVTGKQMEQDVERIVEHYQSTGLPRGEGARRGGDVAGGAGRSWAPSRRAPRRCRATRRRIYVRYTIDEGPRLVLASEDFRTADGEPLPYDKQFLLESVTLRPGRPLHARRRSATTAGAWSGCSATPATRRPASTPTSTASGDRVDARPGC